MRQPRSRRVGWHCALTLVLRRPLPSGTSMPPCGVHLLRVVKLRASFLELGLVDDQIESRSRWPSGPPIKPRWASASSRASSRFSNASFSSAVPVPALDPVAVPSRLW